MAGKQCNKRGLYMSARTKTSITTTTTMTTTTTTINLLLDILGTVDKQAN